jgi:hypothetical protein
VATRTATTHTFYIGVGDTLPIIEEQILQSTGAPLDLTNATQVRFSLVRVDSGVYIPKLDLVAATIIPGDLTLGWVSYHWVTGDTDTEGEFFRKWTVNFNAAVVTMPNYLDKGYPVLIT